MSRVICCARIFPPTAKRCSLPDSTPFERLVRLERVGGEDAGRCVIPPRCWRALIGGGVATVIMAHNHPSNIAQPSDADIATTRETALFLRTMGIELVDHLIFVEGGHFSFRSGEML